MKKPPKTLLVTYELITPDPAKEAEISQRLDRAFDILFDAVLEDGAGMPDGVQFDV